MIPVPARQDQVLAESNSYGRRVSDQTNICIIDDDGPFREAIASLVELLGYRVFAFASAEAFLASDAVDSTHCVITDIQCRA
jgi:FixJ family two-component response regulator